MVKNISNLGREMDMDLDRSMRPKEFQIGLTQTGLHWEMWLNYQKSKDKIILKLARRNQYKGTHIRLSQQKCFEPWENRIAYLKYWGKKSTKNSILGKAVLQE